MLRTLVTRLLHRQSSAHLVAVIVACVACRDPDSVHSPDAVARAPVDASIRRELPAPRARLGPPMPRPTAPDAGVWTRGRGFLGGDDAAQLARLCRAPIERIERNRGGSTLSFRVWLAGGQRALFKPQQRAEVANFRAELASFRLSRLLDLHRTPPACGRLVHRDLLQRAADTSGDTAFSQRVMTELLGRSEEVPGAMLFWVPGALEPVPGVERYAQLLDITRPLLPADVSLAAELSALLLFDFLEDNVDRWSGGNILRPRAAPGEPSAPMLFMDNGASFSALNGGLGARPSDQAARLDHVQRFSPSLLRSLRALTAASLQSAVAEDALGPCLSEAQIQALLTRRDRIVAHADEVAAAHPQADVFTFP
jgi:hypothetical protein